MGENDLSFDHIHIISEDPRASAAWYVDKLGAEIKGETVPIILVSHIAATCGRIARYCAIGG